MPRNWKLGCVLFYLCLSVYPSHYGYIVIQLNSSYKLLQICSFGRYFKFVIFGVFKRLNLFLNNTLHLRGASIMSPRHNNISQKFQNWLCYNTVTLEWSAGASLCLVVFVFMHLKTQDVGLFSLLSHWIQTINRV